jgi:type IV pilus assembly protein PilF
LVALALGVMLGGCASTSGVRPDDGDGTGELGALKPGSPAVVYVELAAEYLRQKDYTLALQNAKKGVIVDPSYASASTVLALVYQQIGERAEAERYYRRAIDLDARDPYALNAYGGFLCSGKRYDEADAMFKRALQNPLYRTPWVAQANAGLCAEQAGRLADAEAYLRSALRANPRFAPALLRMASISYNQGKMMSARAYLQRYQEVAEHTSESLWLGIRTERQHGDQDQVASYSLLLRARFPDSEEVQLLNESRTP